MVEINIFLVLGCNGDWTSPPAALLLFQEHCPPPGGGDGDGVRVPRVQNRRSFTRRPARDQCLHAHTPIELKQVSILFLH